MIEQIVLGLVQGIAEWLPVSSEGLIVLVQSYFFQTNKNLDALVADALFLHLGTVFAAIVYFHKDIHRYVKAMVSWKDVATGDKNVIIFLVITTVISGGLGYALLQVLVTIEEKLQSSTMYVIVAIGFMLLITGALQFIKPRQSHRTDINIHTTDGVLMGVVQGFAAIPGLSRSGLTVAGLLLRNYDKEAALRISFLMSIPIVLAGNVVFAIGDTSFDPITLVGLVVAFVSGLITIAALIRLARKINFGYFVIIFGLITIASAFI